MPLPIKFYLGVSDSNGPHLLDILPALFSAPWYFDGVVKSWTYPGNHLNRAILEFNLI